MHNDNVASDLKFSRAQVTSSLLILYATETGNALDAAEQFVKEAILRHYEIRLYSIDSYPLVCGLHSIKNYVYINE